MSAREVNFDGLVGPTHNYGGLAWGNVASEQSTHAISNPKAAALQGLHKMRVLHDLGVPQAVLPPHERPAVYVLRKLGLEGGDEEVLQKAKRDDPRLLAACSSASSMWAANAATVCPSADSIDAKVHFTPANLRSNFHRQIEVPTTARVLRAVFDQEHFVHHAPLPANELFGDEGAANHTRLCSSYGDPGVQIFTYGRRALDRDAPRPTRYPARQTLEASRAICRLHRLPPERAVFAQQDPSAIDSGVFHNDVIAVGNQNTLFFHERAYLDPDEVKSELNAVLGAPLHLIEVSEKDITVGEAVASYLFNSQLVTLDTGKMALIVPEECKNTERVWGYLQALAANDDVVDRIEVVELRQSMRNGGGPACMRLRVVLTEEELCHINQAVRFDEGLCDRLIAWVDEHYREELSDAELADPLLLEESRTALDKLTQILDLGSIYPFQL